MESYQALEKAMGKLAAAMAKALGTSSSIVYKWMQPNSDDTDSGTSNPLDRLEVITKTALENGQSFKNAIAPIRYLADKNNLLIIKKPKRTDNIKDITISLLNTVKEFGDHSAVAAEALKDNKISKAEFKEIKKEAEEAINSMMSFVEIARQKAEGWQHSLFEETDEKT